MSTQVSNEPYSTNTHHKSSIGCRSEYLGRVKRTRCLASSASLMTWGRKLCFIQSRNRCLASTALRPSSCAIPKPSTSTLRQVPSFSKVSEFQGLQFVVVRVHDNERRLGYVGQHLGTKPRNQVHWIEITMVITFESFSKTRCKPPQWVRNQAKFVRLSSSIHQRIAAVATSFVLLHTCSIFFICRVIYGILHELMMLMYVALI